MQSKSVPDFLRNRNLTLACHCDVERLRGWWFGEIPRFLALLNLDYRIAPGLKFLEYVVLRSPSGSNDLSHSGTGRLGQHPLGKLCSWDTLGHRLVRSSSIVACFEVTRTRQCATSSSRCSFPRERTQSK